MRYSNGYGHLIISIVIVLTLAGLIAFHVIDVSTGMAPFGIVVAFWFLSGTANRFGANGNPPNPGATDHAAAKAAEAQPVPQSKITNATVPTRPPAAG